MKDVGTRLAAAFGEPPQGHGVPRPEGGEAKRGWADYREASDRKMGSTILEVLIVVSILSLIITSTLYFVITSQRTFDVGTMTSYLESEASRLSDIIKEKLTECKVTVAPSTANDFASFSFQVPVLVSGAYWDDDGNIYWGAEDNQNWSYNFSFVSTRILNETSDLIDYNGDNDIEDFFDVGEIRLSIRDADDNDQTTVILCRNVITVAGVGNRFLDINNDGQNDPLFTMLDSRGRQVITNGERFRINLWLGGLVTSNRETVLVNSITEVVMLNPQ
jgi:type II secretory pathway pseudopilin PulG